MIFLIIMFFIIDFIDCDTFASTLMPKLTANSLINKNKFEDISCNFSYYYYLGG